MKEKEFIDFISNVLIPQLESYNMQLSENHEIIIDWSRASYDGDLKKVELSPNDLNGIRAFIIKMGNNIDVNSPQLIFGLNANEEMVIYSQIVPRTKPDKLKIIQNIEEIQPSHIYGFIDNHHKSVMNNI